MYESTDFSIPSLLLNLELTRTYNSQSDKEGMLGKGWYDSFHKELYQLGDDLVFQDSDGTYLTYSPQKSRSVDVSYQNKETKDYALSFNTEDDVKDHQMGIREQRHMQDFRMLLLKISLEVPFPIKEIIVRGKKTMIVKTVEHPKEKRK